MAEVKFKRKSTSEVQNLPIEDGSFIVDYESGSAYIDYLTDRIQISGGGDTPTGGTPEKIGVIKLFSGSTAPDGWMICDGSAISRTTYSTLFSLIGTTYGSGDGSTTFNIPNLKGKTVVGIDEDDTDFDTLGETGGSKTHQHNTSLFSKDVNGAGGDVMINWNGSQYGLDRSGTTVASGAWGNVSASGNAGSKTGYPYKTSEDSSLQPYIVLNYIIKVGEETPVTDTASIINGYSESETDGYSANYINNNFETKGTLLWTNPNPDNSFSQQIITISTLPDYDEFEIFYYDSTNRKAVSSTKFLNGKSVNMMAMFQWGDHGNVGNRNIIWNTDTKLQVNDAVTIIVNDTFSRTANNGWCIPLYIVGYKTGLFS